MLKDPSNLITFPWEGNGMPFLSSSVSHQATTFKNMISSNNKTKHNTTQHQQNTRLLHQVQSENNNNTSCNNLPWT
jgi:hypothetical protein